MYWCISIALLISYIMFGEAVLLTASGLFAIAASIACVATNIKK